MRSISLMLLCVVALAGCSTPDATETIPTAPVDLGERTVPQVFSDSFSLEINPDAEVAAIGGTNSNCVFFWDTGGADYTILRGNATLEWDAQPNSQVFSISTMGAAENAESTGGGSPVRWELPELTVRDDGWGIGFRADSSVVDATMPVAQAATLTLSFEYEGTLPRPSVGGCGGGGP